jgi:hypothetical protein
MTATVGRRHLCQGPGKHPTSLAFTQHWRPDDDRNAGVGPNKATRRKMASWHWRPQLSYPKLSDSLMNCHSQHFKLIGLPSVPGRFVWPLKHKSRQLDTSHPSTSAPSAAEATARPFNNPTTTNQCLDTPPVLEHGPTRPPLTRQRSCIPQPAIGTSGASCRLKRRFQSYR